MLMLVFNVFLFFSSWNVSVLPNFGFSTVTSSFFLCLQNGCVWAILNNRRISTLSFLEPSEFMIGVALGITIGGAILSFILSTTFNNVSKCDHADTDPLYEYVCGGRKGSLSAVWFWSGLVFWLNFCSCLLLAIGRRELTQSSQYESIAGGGGMPMDDYEDHFRRAQAHRPNNPGTAFPGDMPTPTPSFVGDYANVPEVRSHADEDDYSTASENSHHTSHSEKARTITSV